MKNESRIVELLSEMLQKFDVLNDEARGMNRQLGKVETILTKVQREVGKVQGEVGKVKREIVKLNLVSSENSRALMQLANTHDRIVRLERAVFK